MNDGCEFIFEVAGEPWKELLCEGSSFDVVCRLKIQIRDWRNQDKGKRLMFSPKHTHLEEICHHQRQQSPL